MAHQHRAPIEMSPYDPDWPTSFEAERALLLSAFAGVTVQVEHIGSTAVPGLNAKPIIDILLGADAITDIEARISVLEAEGYEYMPEHEDVFPQRRFLAKPRQRPRRFHLHAVERSATFWADHLLFRDLLRAHCEVALAYGQLKSRLASTFGDDREGYTDAKSAFIGEALKQARKGMLKV